MLMGVRGRERPMKTERLLLQRDAARNAPTQSWCARAAVPDLWFWPARLVVGGLLRPERS